jgi:hypothetical protein
MSNAVAAANMDRTAGISRTFALAGRAVFTVSNENSGERYTYRVSAKPSRMNPTENTYFVSLLAGSDNESDYRYIGLLDPATLEVRTTARSQYRADSKPVQVIAWALRHVAASRALPTGYALRHAGRCARCGRLLTVPESIDSGFGPECIGRL